MEERDSWPSGWRRYFQIVVGAALLLSVAVSLARFIEFKSPLLYGVVPVAPALAAITAVGFAATIGRRVALATGTTVLVAVGLLLPGSVIPRTGCDVTTVEGEEGAIVLMSHNVRWHTNDGEAVARQINSLDPDVVLLQESDDEFLAELLPLLDGRYPNVVSTAEKTTALAILSRWPLADIVDTWADPYDINPFLIASVEGPGGSIRVANVHPSAPINSHLQNRQKQEYREMSTPSFQDGLDVIAGDFNSSASHIDFRRLTGTGWVDAHREAGCGLGLTWSNLEPGVGILSLDHLLAADTITVEQFQVLDYAGSDHRAIAVVLKVKPDAP